MGRNVNKHEACLHILYDQSFLQIDEWVWHWMIVMIYHTFQTMRRSYLLFFHFWHYCCWNWNWWEKYFKILYESLRKFPNLCIPSFKFWSIIKSIFKFLEFSIIYKKELRINLDWCNTLCAIRLSVDLMWKYWVKIPAGIFSFSFFTRKEFQ